MPNNPFQNLPQGWEVKTLGEIFLIERGGSPRPIKEYLTTNLDGINWIKIGDTKNITKYITKTAQKIKLEGKKYSRFVEIGDLILSNSMSFGKPYIMKTTGCIHDGWVVFKQSKKVIDEEFCYYVLSSSEIYAQFDKLATGSTVKNLNIERIKQIPIPLPPLETQQKIVAKLESEFAKIESAKSHLEKVKETIPRLKNSLLKSAFSGELTQPYKDEKNASHRHCEDSSESEAIYNAELPLKDFIAESKAAKIVDCHELRCNSRNDKNIAQTPNFTQAPNLGGATLVAQNLQNSTNPPNCHLEHSEETRKESSCHSEALAEESQNIKPHKDSILKDISATPQYDKTTSICHVDFPSCHSDLECNEREESQRHLANTQYEKDSNLPQDWEIKTLGEIFEVIGGGTPSTEKPEFWSGDIAWITSANIASENFTITPQKFINQEAIKSSATKLVPKNTIIVVTRVGLGKVGITNVETCFSQDSQALLPLQIVDTKFMAFQIKKEASQFIINSRGTTISGITKDTLKKLKLKIPPLQTQKQIVEILDSKFAALENLERETNASLEKLQRFKSSFLNLAFKGELIC